MVDISVPPGQVWWFADWRPKDFLGPCSHSCQGAGVSIVAWGSDLFHYELVECNECGCRAWKSACSWPWQWWRVE